MRATIRNISATAGLVLLSWLFSVAPASAHDLVAPANVVAGSKVTVTVAVVNEHPLPTDGVEVRLPPGFALRSAEDVPGWRTEPQRRADGTVTAVRWTGGLLERNASGEFVVAGTAPATPGSLVWAAGQKSVGSKVYVPPPVTIAPHMTVAAAPLGGASPVDQVPLATQAPVEATDPVDGVARSRATLALVLAGLALLGVVVFGAAAARRSLPGPSWPSRVEADPVEPAFPLPEPRPAGASAKRLRQRAMSGGTNGR